MKFKHYLYAAGLLLAGATTTAMVAAGEDAPDMSPDFLFAHEFNPANGSTVESLNEIQLVFPNVGMYDGGMTFNTNMMTFTMDPETSAIATNGETTYFIAASILPLSEEYADGETEYEGQTEVKVMELRFIPMDEDDPNLVVDEQGYVMEFPAGEYTLTFPEGTFTYGGDGGWMAEGEEGSEPVASPAFSATFTVGTEEPIVKDVFEYDFNPVSGSTVKTLDDIELIFPNLGMLEGGQLFLQTMPGMSGADFATATNGEVTYLVGAAVLPLLTEDEEDYEGPMDVKIMKLFFIDPEDEEGDGFVHEFAAGEWTITIPAGTFAYDPTGATPFAEGEEEEFEPIMSPEITGTFTVEVVDTTPFEIIGFIPSENAPVKELKTITLIADSKNQSLMVMGIKGGESQITLTGNGETIEGVSFGQVKYSETTGDLLMPITFPAVTEAGEYILNVPAGIFVQAGFDDDWNYGPIEGGVVNAAATATFTVDPSVKSAFEGWSFIPEAGATVETLDGLMLQFPEIEVGGLGIVDNLMSAAIASNGVASYEGDIEAVTGSAYTCETVRIFDFYDWNAWKNAEFTPGEWTVTIPAGKFSFNGEESPEITGTFIVGEDEPQPAATFEIAGFKPLDGKTVRELSTIFIEIASEGGELMIEPQMDKLAEITLTNPRGIAVSAEEFGETSFNEMTGMYQFQVIFEAQTAQGTYTLNVPEGVFAETEWSDADDAFVPKAGGMVNAAATAEYMVDPNAPNPLEMEFTPKSGSKVGSLSEIRIEFPNLSMMAGGEEFLMSKSEDQYGMPYIIATNEEAEVAYIGMAAILPFFDDDYEGDGDTKVMALFFFDPENDFEEIPADFEFAEGEWTILFRAGAFEYEGDESPEFEVVYVVDPELTGINGVNVDNSKVTVVTVDGRVVLKNASADQLNGLDKGIYIVNGKKVVIRK